MTSQTPPETPSEPTPPQPPTPPQFPAAPQAAAPPPPPPPIPPPPRPPQAPWPPPPYYYPQPPRRSSGWLWGCGLGAAGCLFLLLLGIAAGIFALVSAVGSVGKLSVSGAHDFNTGAAEIALIRIEGAINTGPSGYSPFAGQATGSDDVVSQIERAVRDDNIKAILLRVNSPGGSAAGSQEIYNALKAARQRGRKVVVSMADVAASGGYYVSAPADKIYADPATFTGSIGVIAIHEDMSGLFGKIGVKTETLKSGKLKDMGSPYAPLADDARAVMKTLLMQVYDQFVEAVAEGRNMPVAEVRALADGRIYTGEQAVTNGLVDELGGMREALDGAAELSGARSSAYTEFGVPPLLKWLLGGQAQSRGRVIQTRLPDGLLYDHSAAALAWGERKPTQPE